MNLSGNVHSLKLHFKKEKFDSKGSCCWEPIIIWLRIFVATHPLNTRIEMHNTAGGGFRLNEILGVGLGKEVVVAVGDYQNNRGFISLSTIRRASLVDGE